LIDIRIILKDVSTQLYNINNDGQATLYLADLPRVRQLSAVGWRADLRGAANTQQLRR